jgi:hypothetical protein
MRILANGNIGVRSTTSTAYLQFGAGLTTTAPLQFTMPGSSFLSTKLQGTLETNTTTLGFSPNTAGRFTIGGRNCRLY